MAARLSNEQTRFIVKQLTLGSAYIQIKEEFEKKFERTVTDITIGRIKKRNLEAITSGRSLIAAEGATSAALIRQKSNQLLERRLDDAIEDSVEIRKLRKKFQNKEITESQLQVGLASYEKLTINELTKVSEAMHSQAKGEDADPVTPQDQAALAALIAGIQSGNPIALIQQLTVNQPAAA